MAEYVELENVEKKLRVKMFHFGKYSFSSIEIKHLTYAFIFLALTLYVFQRDFKLGSFSVGEFIGSLFGIFLDVQFLLFLLVFALAFLLHEFAHKFVAQYYGFISEFRADFQMLIIMFVVAIFSPFIFLAPGAVMIVGKRITLKQNGIISIAGPLVNLVQAFIFFIALQFINPVTSPLLAYFTFVGVYLNAFLGIFNMLPFWILDGKKVLQWSPIAYGLVMVPLVLLFLTIF